MCFQSRGRFAEAFTPLLVLKQADFLGPNMPLVARAPFSTFPSPHLAIHRSQRAPHMHVLVCICSNVRQFHHNQPEPMNCYDTHPYACGLCPPW